MDRKRSLTATAALLKWASAIRSMPPSAARFLALVTLVWPEFGAAVAERAAVMSRAEIDQTASAPDVRRTPQPPAARDIKGRLERAWVERPNAH